MFYLFIFLLFSTLSPAQGSSLKTLESYTLPVPEISGMAWRKNPETNKKELIVVSDRNYVLYIVDWDSRDQGLKVTAIDLSHTKISGDDKQSEWESVSCDESGRAYILKENPSRILVTSVDLKKIERVISLPGGNGSFNSGGEGVTLLKNGHLLVVNEKDPLQIIEYGPVGAKASGYNPEFSMEVGGLFPLDLSEKVPLFRWSLNKESLRSLEDASGINVDKEGNLYLLSDQKQSIGLIGNQLDAKNNILNISKIWKLPKNIKQPEGMVIDESSQPIIAIDSLRINKANLFLLSPLK